MTAPFFPHPMIVPFFPHPIPGSLLPGSLLSGIELPAVAGPIMLAILVAALLIGFFAPTVWAKARAAKRTALAVGLAVVGGALGAFVVMLAELVVRHA